MSLKSAVVAFGFVTLVGAPLTAATARAQINNQSSPNQEQLIQRLQEAREVASENEASWTQEPITAREFGHQESQLNDLITKLKDGKNVSPEQVDQALKSPDTPY